MNKLLLTNFCLLTLLLFNCGYSQRQEHSFSIYLIKDGKFTEIGKDPYYLKNVKIDLHEADLEEKPVISDKDIIEYDWKNHIVTITTDAAAQIPDPNSFGIPFVVVADGHRCYLGGFWTMASSVSCPRPIIEVNDASDGTFTIRPGYPGDFAMPGGNDPRFDERVKKSLKALGKLKINGK